MKNAQLIALRLRNAAMIAAATGSVAGAQTTGASTFDTSSLETTATAVLGVGALIAVGFAVFKVGKRAMNKV